MRRRALLATVGAAAGGVAGYVALDRVDTDGGPAGTSSDQESYPFRSVARPVTGSVDVTPTDALRSQVAITAGSDTPQEHPEWATAIEALEGNTLVLVSVRAERSDSRGRFPRRSEFELATESGSYGPLDLDGRVRQPIDADRYSGAGVAGPGDRTRSGWLLFDVPRSAETATLALPNLDVHDDWAAGGDPSWEIDLERLDRVDLETTLRTGGTVPLADTTDVRFHTVNRGNREAWVYRLPEADLNGRLEPVEYTVPAGGERTGSTTVAAPGYRESIEFETRLESTTLDVEPIRADWGETWTDPNGLEVTCSNPTLADRVEHAGRQSPEGPTDGWEYLVFEVDVVNESPSLVHALPIGTSFWAVVEEGGESETYHRGAISTSDPVAIHSPIEGREWTAEYNLSRGESAGGLVVIQIPDVRDLTDVGLRVAYSNSDTRDPEDGTLAYVGIDGEG